MTLDFAGRRVVEDEAINYEQISNDDVLTGCDDNSEEHLLTADHSFPSLVNPSIKGPLPQFVPVNPNGEEGQGRRISFIECRHTLWSQGFPNYRVKGEMRPAKPFHLATRTICP